MNSKRVLFNDGEGIDLNDVNIAQDQLRNLVLGTLLERTAGMSNGLGWLYGADGKYRVNTIAGIPAIGGWASPGSTRHMNVYPGMFWDVALAGAIEDQFDDPTSKMAIGTTSAGSIGSYATSENVGPGSANTSGSDRWDSIEVEIVQSDGDAETRDFEDASTRALTSTSQSKRKRWAAVFTIHEGTGGAAGEVYKGPAVTAGKHKLCAMLLPNAGTAYTDVRDFRIPIAPIRRTTVVPKHAMVTSDGWTSNDDGSIERSANAKYAYILLGNGYGNTRLLDLIMSYKLAAGSTVKLGLVEMAAGGISFDEIIDISSSFTLDGTARYAHVDMSAHGVWFNGVGAWCEDNIVTMAPSIAFTANIPTGFAIQIKTGSAAQHIVNGLQIAHIGP